MTELIIHSLCQNFFFCIIVTQNNSDLIDVCRTHGVADQANLSPAGGVLDHKSGNRCTTTEVFLNTWEAG